MAFAVCQGRAEAQHLLDGGIRDNLRAVLPERGDRVAVEVVEMLVRDEDDIGLGELRIVGGGGKFGDWIDLDFESVVLDAQAGVLDRGNYDLLAAFGLERVCLAVACDASRRHQDGRRKNGWCFHWFLSFRWWPWEAEIDDGPASLILSENPWATRPEQVMRQSL